MIALVFLLGCGGSEVENTHPWEAWALDCGRSRFKMGDEQVPFAWSAWLLRGWGRTILVDTGFEDHDDARKWGVKGFRLVPEILEGAGLTTDDVTDVVITHGHWDHVGHVAPYTSATLWVQEAELDWMRSRVSPDRPVASGVRLADLAQLEAAGERLRGVDGTWEIAPGVTLRHSGHHTPGSQWVEVDNEDHTLVLAGDIAPLFTYLETVTVPPTSPNPAADQKVIAEMIETADPDRLAIPGHDPLVFERFDSVHPRVVRLR